MDEQALRAFGAYIIRLQSGGNLTREEAHEAYGQIFQNRQPELQQGALVAAHACVPPDVEALVGITQAHNDEWSRCIPATIDLGRPHLGIVGVGMDSLKSFNVSSAAAVVASACGVPVHKVGAPGMTGPSGSADAFALWGVDLACPIDVAYKGVAQIGLGFTTPVSPALRHMGIGRVLGQMRCKTMIHLAGPMGFHSGERHKIIGVPAPPMTGLVAEAMRRLGYAAALVPCGTASEAPGRFMDEFSNVGPTHAAWLRGGEVEHLVVTPADFGVDEAKVADIAAGEDRAANARMGARAIAGLTPGPHEDLLVINAAACLVLMGAASDWRDGARQARQAITTGRARSQ
ncbi:MAG: hypothetical protein KC549_17145, partial [Myxococcales bacterium]|nr:hypothetical protein [Myxococcales bacterium]